MRAGDARLGTIALLPRRATEEAEGPALSAGNQGMLHVHLHLAALEPLVQFLQHMCLHLP